MPEKYFNPDSPAASGSNVFGLPCTTSGAKTILLPVPWDVSVSFRDGTSMAPQKILAASKQIDLFHPDIPGVWNMSVAMATFPFRWEQMNKTLRTASKRWIDFISDHDPGKPLPPKQKKIIDALNRSCEELTEWVKKESVANLQQNKFIGIIGGDHSCPLGLIEALSEKYSSFGILHIDAHCDLRDSYEEFRFSHASIMHNALKCSSVKKLVQAGIRDYCSAEETRIKDSDGRIIMFHNDRSREKMYGGGTWKSIVSKIISYLPSHVYISFDVDGLEPALCPNTGTPVPGGLTFDEAVYLIKTVVKCNKKIIGFDLCETGNAEWDAIVASRILFHLTAWMAVSQGLMGGDMERRG
ncbi:MAG: agmatinase family protein [Bacteroidetes bacterium]|nr:agmatinase family protein [Bacteroidota bacterium]